VLSDVTVSQDVIHLNKRLNVAQKEATGGTRMEHIAVISR
jgi:hypothetical protein